MAGQTYKTSGFGFALPKGSPLVADLSRAILNITEGDEMTEIETRWFGNQKSCPNQGSVLSSNASSLDFISFWVLFLITGSVSVLCCLIYMSRSAYRNRRLFRDITAEQSFRMRLLGIARLFVDGGESSLSDESKAIGLNTAGASAIPSPSALPFPEYHESQTSISNDALDGGSPLSGLSSWIPEARPQVEIVQVSEGSRTERQV